MPASDNAKVLLEVRNLSQSFGTRIIGMNYGMISGFIGGRTDFIMQQIVDVAGSIPTLVIVTILMLILKPGISSILIALMLTGWMEMSLIARAQVLRLKDQEFILAARTLGERQRIHPL
ncbi:MAG TPA: hypothetical protein DCL38_00075 [Lachnospiraceae bacterium]|nr:hypothetical protein [Lachnospiraceae bacterium]